MNNENYPMRLNIGCGGVPLPDYINIDSDNLDTLRDRYPSRQFDAKIKIYQYDIFNLPYEDDSVDEVKADSLIEHLSFSEEPKFLYEVVRVLRPGGIFDFSTTDFEEIVKLWLAADDEWKDFFRDDDTAISQQHWFGQYSYSSKSRWGYLTAMIFGSQNGEGQLHKNCYTVGKIRSLLNKLNLNELEISRFRWKGDRDPMIRVKAVKPS